VLNKYIDAIGGVKKIKKIKDITIQASATMQGMTLILTSISSFPTSS
jgi:hypothetical protein